jgi:hypothetical protein
MPENLLESLCSIVAESNLASDPSELEFRLSRNKPSLYCSAEQG